jgi:hypothetical protein
MMSESCRHAARGNYDNLHVSNSGSNLSKCSLVEQLTALMSVEWTPGPCVRMCVSKRSRFEALQARRTLHAINRAVVNDARSRTWFMQVIVTWLTATCVGSLQTVTRLRGRSSESGV